LKQVNLSAEIIDTIDSIGLNLAAGIEQTTGVPVELTRPQIIHAIAKKVLWEQDRLADSADTEDES
jgi:hypothetical protein